MGDARSNGQLVAFLDTNSSFDEQEAFTALARVLPSYAIPQQLVPIGALPKTANGKLDRNALPNTILPTVTSATAPSTPSEALLADAVGRLLNRTDVPLDARFFDLGGHSLLAMQLMAELEAATGKRPSLASLLLEPLTVVAQQLPEVNSQRQPGVLRRWLAKLTGADPFRS